MKKINLIAMLLFSTLTIFSCAKKEGCTINTAKNFDSKAEKDDGSCQYEGKLAFWYNKTMADSLNQYGITSLVYKVDGAIIGTSLTSVYFTSEPACSTTGLINVTKSLGSNTSKSIAYTIEDQNGTLIESGTQVVSASNSSCTLVELQW